MRQKDDAVGMVQLEIKEENKVEEARLPGAGFALSDEEPRAKEGDKVEKEGKQMRKKTQKKWKRSSRKEKGRKLERQANKSKLARVNSPSVHRVRLDPSKIHFEILFEERKIYFCIFTSETGPQNQKDLTEIILAILT